MRKKFEQRISVAAAFDVFSLLSARRNWQHAIVTDGFIPKELIHSSVETYLVDVGLEQTILPPCYYPFDTDRQKMFRLANNSTDRSHNPDNFHQTLIVSLAPR
jgi:hypothetical protein